MPVSMTHIALHCEDIVASIAFYCDWCSLHIVRDRFVHDVRVAWLAEPGKENEFVVVLIGGGNPHHQHPEDFSHLGFDVSSQDIVDAKAERAKAEGILSWPTRELPPPVGYFCGIADPDGRIVEFSHGQPIGHS